MFSELKKIASVLAVGSALLLTTAPANAAITYATDTSTSSTIPGLTGFSTTGAMMSGMSVTAMFSGGVSQTLSWATTGASSGGVTGSGWDLSLNGDSFGGNWLFNIDANANLGQLVTLVLNGNPGLTLFDRTFGGATGTNGSALGMDFVFVSGYSGDATVTYSDIVNVTPDAAVGDLFHIVTIAFGTGGPRGNFVFNQDTDNDSRFGTVPEPASLALLGLGLAGLALARRRKYI